MEAPGTLLACGLVEQRSRARQSWIEAGIAHHRAGALAQAAEAFGAALQDSPDDGQLWKIAGILDLERERIGEAVDKLTTASRYLPDDPDLQCSLSMARREQGDFLGAIEAGRRAVALRPGDGGGQLALGRALLRAGHYAEAALALICAERSCDRPETEVFLALALRLADLTAPTVETLRAIVCRTPNYGEAWNALGLALKDKGDVGGAIRCYVQAIEQQPDDVEPLVNYGNILAGLNRVDDALAILDFALSRHPDHAEVIFNRGVYLEYLHRLDEALAAYDRVLELDSGHRFAGWNRSLLLLMQGRPEGWALYENRWDVPDFPDRQQQFDEPVWTGEDLGGRTLLLHAEQGLGDTLQFIRYAPLIAARGGRVVVQCQKALVRLLTGMAGIAQVLAKGEPLPAFDVHLPTMSAPARFETTLATVPPPVAYATIDPVTLPGGTALKVGLVWSGNPGHRNDAHRSIPFAQLAALFDIDGVRYFSLQVGTPAPEREDLIDLGAGFRDFADTAAAMMALDLVISVDTSAAHLAGTLGKPTLLLLPLRSDWRWLSGRDDTPWYPSVRIVRQSRVGEWGDVVQRVLVTLEALLAANSLPAGAP